MHKMIGTTDRLEGGVLVGVQGPWLLMGCTTSIPWPGINNYRVNTVIVLLMHPPPQILKGLGVIFLRPLLGHQNEMPTAMDPVLSRPLYVRTEVKLKLKGVGGWVKEHNFFRAQETEYDARGTNHKLTWRMCRTLNAPPK